MYCVTYFKRQILFLQIFQVIIENLFYFSIQNNEGILAVCNSAVLNHLFGKTPMELKLILKVSSVNPIEFEKRFKL